MAGDVNKGGGQVVPDHVASPNLAEVLFEHASEVPPFGQEVWARIGKGDKACAPWKMLHHGLEDGFLQRWREGCPGQAADDAVQRGAVGEVAGEIKVLSGAVGEIQAGVSLA